MSLFSKHAIIEKNSIILLVGILVVIAIGGLLFLTGALVMVYNLWRTARGDVPALDRARGAIAPLPAE